MSSHCTTESEIRRLLATTKGLTFCASCLLPNRSLKTKLQRKLNLPWRPRRCEAPELRSTKNGCVVAVLRPAVRKQEVRVVQDIKELCPEFQICSFRRSEILEGRKIPGRVAG